MSNESIKPTKRKLAFYITGPESAGNRLMARSLHTAGVKNAYVTGQDTYVSAPHHINYNDDPLVICMSIPHNHVWPDIARGYLDIRYDEEYNEIRKRIVWMILDRETDYMTHSQIAQTRLLKKSNALRYIKRARAEIEIAVEFLEYLEPEIIRVQYEEFVTDSKYRKELFVSFGFPEPTIKYFNANERGI